jgi:hypothetical protein
VKPIESDTIILPGIIGPIMQKGRTAVRPYNHPRRNARRKNLRMNHEIICQQ